MENPSVVEIGKKWNEPGACFFRFNSSKWSVASLWNLSKDLKIQEMPMSALNTHNLQPELSSVRDFVEHMKSVLAADMNYPIILDQDGFVMDGRHRIMKALLEGHESIKYVRFVDTPSPDFVESA